MLSWIVVCLLKCCDVAGTYVGSAPRKRLVIIHCKYLIILVIFPEFLLVFKDKINQRFAIISALEWHGLFLSL